MMIRILSYIYSWETNWISGDNDNVNIVNTTSRKRFKRAPQKSDFIWMALLEAFPRIIQCVGICTYVHSVAGSYIKVLEVREFDPVYFPQCISILGAVDSRKNSSRKYLYRLLFIWVNFFEYASGIILAYCLEGMSTRIANPLTFVQIIMRETEMKSLPQIHRIY